MLIDTRACLYPYVTGFVPPRRNRIGTTSMARVFVFFVYAAASVPTLLAPVSSASGGLRGDHGQDSQVRTKPALLPPICESLPAALSTRP